MKRLFVGLPVPSKFTEPLSQLQPESGPGVRPVPRSQMHVTLVFIGQAEPQAIAEALQSVRGESFRLSFDRLGQFGSARRGGILWLGAQDHPRLTDLHTAIADALLPQGVAREERPFTPHITLARFRRGTAREVIDSFVGQQLPTLPALPVEEFVLYSSRQTQDGSVYTHERRYSLDANSAS